MTLPAIDPLWRQTTEVSDFLLLRRWLSVPGHESSLIYLIEAMNTMARIVPSDIPTVQSWLDAIVELDDANTAEINAGTAHLGEVEEYEGPKLGAEITDDQRRTQLDVIQWDAGLLKERRKFRTGAVSTAQGQRNQRIARLVREIALALHWKVSSGPSLVRS